MILLLELLAVIVGYKYVSAYVRPSSHWVGFVVYGLITMALPALSTVINPWPLGIPILLSAYVALGIGVKTIYKPDTGESGGGGSGRGTLKA